MSTITLVCGGLDTCSTLKEQLEGYIGRGYDITLVPLDPGMPEKIESDLVIFSSSSVEKECRSRIDRWSARKLITAGRTLKAGNIGKLVNIDSGERVLFVNDHEESARECIGTLREIGFLHLDLVPCAPPGLDPSGCRIAVTAGEARLVPRGIPVVYDLGCRIMDFSTILRIARYLKVDLSEFENPSLPYIRQIVKEASRVKTLNTRLLKMIEGLSEGMISYQFGGEILVANEKACSILMLGDRSPVGRKIQDILSDRTLVDFLLSREGEAEGILTLFNRDVVLSRIIHSESRTAVCRFKAVSEMEEDSYKIRELRRKGFFAKYRFDDIVGESPAVIRSRKVAEKLAGSSLTILLEGESGTGKELMASAIHNSSARRDQPYLAVNLSAVNESLLESELFGYEPGAFTGASKEGKPGLFELADGGTIFLDEIGDISPKIQRGLLRVLQEGEVMRIGGSRIRKIDVRIIAATNRNLAEMAGQGHFREDLLFRLRQGYIRIPSLRERASDIPLLVRHLIRMEGIKDIALAPALMEQLRTYSWPGNIRELKNLLACMLAISENHTLMPSDVPDGMFFLPPTDGGPSPGTAPLPEEPEIRVLAAVREVIRDGRIPTRERVAEACRNGGLPFSAARVRSILTDLTERGWLRKPPNRYGLTVTESGRAALGGSQFQ